MKLLHLLEFYVFISPIASDNTSWKHIGDKHSKEFLENAISSQQGPFKFKGNFWGWFTFSEDFWWFIDNPDYEWIFFEKEMNAESIRRR